jgi:hypothetical protein
MSLNKSDLTDILMARGAISRAAAAKLSKVDLETMVGDVTASETAQLEARNQARAPYLAMKAPELKARALTAGVAVSGSKGEIADRLVAAGADPAAVSVYSSLDPDQANVVARWDRPRQIVNAGPGAGKTTVLCALVAEILRQREDARVLMLAFNREASRILTARVKAATNGGSALAPKTTARVKIPPGKVGIRTFNEFAHGLVEGDEAQGAHGGFEFAVGAAAGPEMDYDRELAAGTDALKSATDPELAWDWVIVDEGQDVQVKHAELIRELEARAAHLVVAGDPRQELYSGATWFSQLWVAAPEDDRAVLAYNHRSHPRIVEMLNAFSAAAFPSLHIPQAAARPADSDCGVYVVREPTQEELAEGRATVDVEVASFLRQMCSAPGDAYAISPVSVQKFAGTTELVTGLRQALHADAQWPARVLDSGSGIASLVDVCCIGTSRVLKGTERKAVAVMQTAVPYEKLGLSAGGAAKKLLYVALSRAQDRLLVVLGEKRCQVLQDGAYCALLAACGAVSASGAAQFVPRNLTAVQIEKQVQFSVTDLAKLIKTEPAQIDSGEFAAITMPCGEAPVVDHDFRGCYAEAALARALGVDVAARLYAAVVVDKRSRGVHVCDGCVIIGDETYLALSDKLGEYKERVLGKLESGDVADVPYLCAQALYSFRIDQEWTVSESLEGAVAPREVRGAAQVADELASEACEGGNYWDEDESTDLPESEWRYQAPVRMYLRTHRPRARTHGESAAAAEMLVGVPDLTSTIHNGLRLSPAQSLVVEVKHAADSPEHAVQAAIYGAMVGSSSVAVVNTKLGTWGLYRSYSQRFVSDACRAALALKYGLALPGTRVRSEPFATHAIAVFVDIETEKVADCDALLEVGAIAVSTGDFGYVSHFHQLAAAVADPRAHLAAGEKAGGAGVHARLREMVGLKYSDATLSAICAAENDASEPCERFKKWIAGLGVASSVLVVHWGGRDAVRLGWEGDRLNLIETFKARLEAQGTRGARVTALGEAAATVLGPQFGFEPHRAYEDTVATAAIAAAIVNIGGAV